MADKTSNYATYKAMTREELGDSTKYVKIISKDKNREKIKPVVEIDKEKINEDLKYAGYNLMVTSELDMEPLQVYQTYHCLWKIEEFFRITKSYLNARPVPFNYYWGCRNLLLTDSPLILSNLQNFFTGSRQLCKG